MAMIKLKHSHPWNLSTAEARNIQLQLKEKVIRQDRFGKNIRRVAGVDVGFEKNGTVTRAAVATLTFPQLELYEYAIARRQTEFPYIPGFLSFREIPAVLDALGKLKQLPDMLLCDGQGLAHPRRFGIACHLGVLTDIPAIGVAKSRLLGTHAPVPEEKGGYALLMDGEEEIGAVLRTRSGVNPIYVSIGHRICLPSAIAMVLQCVSKYRLPETTRWADRIASNRTGKF
jgi:deoxyribonuclease V